MKYFDYPRDADAMARFFRQGDKPEPHVDEAVRGIIEQVRRRGDRAVASLTKKLDGVAVEPGKFHVSPSVLKEAWDALDDDLKKALQTAHDRIRAYHEQQMIQGFTYRDALGNRMDQRVAPLRRAGVYAPGGRAAYPSTVLMDIAPARVAGVDQVVMLTPPGRLGEPEGRAVLAAAYLAGVDELIAVGGTPGVAALALGTESIERVDIIVGPGNKFIAAAKRLLYGEITIDMVAGPSEILILADETAPPATVAADMLSQAEHDPDAQAGAVLIGRYDLDALKAELRRQTAASLRKEIVRQSLKRNGCIVRVRTPKRAVELANLKAPEHLEILTRDARKMADGVRNAGAIFLGPWTPEAVGDYAAGPNHTLPTGGTARFFSPLSVWSFLKASHVVECSRKGLEALGDTVVTLAESEGFAAHAEAVRVRLAGGSGRETK